MENKKYSAGVWSAAPTPLTNDGQVDKEAIKRLTEHHLRLGVKGVFLCGTSGEGPWMTNTMRLDTAEATVKAVAGRLKVTVQVTDNSAVRILDNIYGLVDLGVDAVIMAPPFFQQNIDQAYLKAMFIEVLDNSPLPVGFYHRGAHSSVEVTAETVMALMEHPNLIMVKDSSDDRATMKQFVQHATTLNNPPILLNGGEFDCVPYLKAGYDGLLFGGACFNGYLSNKIIDAAKKEDFAGAQQLQDKMSAMMLEIFGGDEFPYWLAAQKQLLVELGIFSTSNTIINYQVPAAHIPVLRKIIANYKAYLLP
ncbi:MAG: dihydrodipicolinate synthase family protein [Victivallaceae bacterium]|nr:dihydrodipicolinate synthase family protein [Victivallaceae bacterium]